MAGHGRRSVAQGTTRMRSRLEREVVPGHGHVDVAGFEGRPVDSLGATATSASRPSTRWSRLGADWATCTTTRTAAGHAGRSVRTRRAIGSSDPADPPTTITRSAR